MRPKLYKKIVQNVEDAFYDDFNMIVEEFQFYQQLTPKQQSVLINEVFGSFIKKFDHFLGSWEEGFKNEFIVQLFTRNYKEYEFFVNAGHEVDSVTLITEGSAHMMSVEGFFIMVLPQKSVFGDFNCAFDTKTLVGLKGP